MVKRGRCIKRNQREAVNSAADEPFRRSLFVSENKKRNKSRYTQYQTQTMGQCVRQFFNAEPVMKRTDHNLTL